jgi:hypothetical protein
MAVHGYRQAYQAVQQSVRNVLADENPGHVADRDHGTWHRELFAPNVAVGLLKLTDLAGSVVLRSIFASRCAYR